jgi:hypothetical protein
MKQEFIPYEQALDLKELGFDDECFAVYTTYSTVKQKYRKNPALSIVRQSSQFTQKTAIKAPLYQQAFRWFREKYKLQHEIYYLDDLIKNSYKITDTSTNTDLTEFQYKHNYFELSGYDFEEAELECLKKLIEIIKNK